MSENLFYLALIERGGLGALVINIVLHNEDFGKILYSNKQFAKFLGLSKAAVQDSFLWEFVSDKAKSRLRDQLLTMAVQNKWDETITLSFVRADHSEIPLKLHVKPDAVLTDNQGFSTQLLVFAERLEDTAFVLDANFEKHKELTQLNAELKEVNSRLNGLLSTLGHDMKNFLSGIFALSKALSEELDEFKQMCETVDDYSDSAALVQDARTRFETLDEFVKHILRSASKAEALLNDLILHKALQAGKRRMQPTLMDMEDLIKDVVEVEKHKFAEKGIELIYELPDETQTFKADPLAITQVLLNLLSNARKFTNHGGRVKITGKLESGSAVFTVEDNGIGIDPSRIPDLYDVSKPTTMPGTKGEEGTGFGLPICYEILAAHGGVLLVETEPGKGSKFTARIPQPPIIADAD